MRLNHSQQLIIVAIGAIVVTVAMLDWKGYLRHSTQEDSVYLAEFNMIKVAPGTEQILASKPSAQQAICVAGHLIIEDSKKTQVAGVLVDKKNRVVSCNFSGEKKNIDDGETVAGKTTAKDGGVSYSN